MSDSHAERLIAAKVQRLEVLELQAARYGIATPPHIAIEIEALRDEVSALHYQRTQLIFQAHGLDLEPPPLAQGLILLMSPQRQHEALHALSTYQAIEYHRAAVRHCWLIVTDGPSGSRATAEALAKHVGAYQVQCTIHVIANGADVGDTRAAVEAIFAQLADDDDGTLRPEDVVVDITGGSKAMTVGAALACGTTRMLQYMLHHPGLPSLPVLLHVNSQETAV